MPAAEVYTLRVPELAVKVVKPVMLAMTTNVPVLPFIVPAPVKARVVVATPEPMTSVPVLARVSVKILSPFTDPMLPALVTAPMKVRVPVVEVTVVPAPMFEMPVTDKALALRLKVPPFVVAKVPVIICPAKAVTVPEALDTVTLL